MNGFVRVPVSGGSVKCPLCGNKTIVWLSFSEDGWKVYGSNTCDHVKEVDWSHVRPVDLVAGGFPCQPVSTAGRRLGTSDPRWLWPEFARCIRVLRPRWILVENVPGILHVNQGEAFAEILRDLAELGYDAEWNSIPAAAFGAPHLRYRIFLVAYPRGRFQPEQQAGAGKAAVPLAARDGQVGSVADAGQYVFGYAPWEARRPTFERNSWWSPQCRLGIHPDGAAS